MDYPRLLKANEISCRVQSVTDKDGAIILLYKDARVDMNILDETYGPMDWTRNHEVINGNLYCTISIWDETKGGWVSKQDVGVESNTEATKGEASDAFKRAGFNWGIGRELYTAPFVFVQLNVDEVRVGNNGKKQASPRFGLDVQSIEYNEAREITSLVLVDKKGVVRFTHGSTKVKAAPAPVVAINRTENSNIKVTRMTQIANDVMKYAKTKDKARIRAEIEEAEAWMKAQKRYTGLPYESLTPMEFADYLKALYEFYNPTNEMVEAVL